MKHFIFLLSFFTLFTGIGQKNMTPCEATTSSGSVIHGYFKKFRPATTIEEGFNLWNEDKKKIKVEPRYYKQVKIGGTEFKSIVNNKGDFRFMRLMVDGDKAKLYLDTHSRMISIPNMGAEMHVTNEFYLGQGENIQYIDRDILKQTPESYFPNAPALCQTIKTTKKKGFTIPAWVEAYNKTASTP